MARGQKLMQQPLNVIFQYMKNSIRVQIWLFDQKRLRLEGIIRGFDEFMNIVLEESEEIDVRNKTKRSIGRIMLKGDNITLLMPLDSQN